MDHTITLTIPSDWLPDGTVNQDELRQALVLGLAQLRQQKVALSITEQTVQALLGTGRIHHLSASLEMDEAKDARREPPPELPGTPVSEILIAQRRGDS